MTNFVKHVIENGGSIHPLIIPSDQTNGTGIFNPSIYNDNGRLLLNIRHCQVTLFQSEKNIYEHEYGPSCYLHPENDESLTTTNFFCELNSNFSIKWISKIDFSKLDTKPIWGFKGLEDCRVFKWNNILYVSGVRRDTTTNGQGRMELCEVSIDNNSNVKEVSRFRIPAPGDDASYCEKNWMPITDMPYHYVKWTNPVEIVKVDPKLKTCITVFAGKNINFSKDQRGGSHVIPIGHNGDRFCITHEVVFFYGYKNENNKKNATYRHKILLFDKNWNVTWQSDSFSFMGAEIEFCSGITKYNDDYLITFGVTDNAAYLLRCPKQIIENSFYG